MTALRHLSDCPAGLSVKDPNAPGPIARTFIPDYGPRLQVIWLGESHLVIDLSSGIIDQIPRMDVERKILMCLRIENINPIANPSLVIPIEHLRFCGIERNRQIQLVEERRTMYCLQQHPRQTLH